MKQNMFAEFYSAKYDCGGDVIAPAVLQIYKVCAHTVHINYAENRVGLKANI